MKLKQHRINSVERRQRIDFNIDILPGN